MLQVFTQPEKDLFDFDMNLQYLIFWNQKKIQYFNLEKPFYSGKNGYLQKIDINLLETEDLAKIRTGNNDNKIAIIIEEHQYQSQKVIQWNMHDNIEKYAYNMKE